VVIVTESTARRFWPGKDPLGKSMSRNKIEMQVIGVAKDAQVSSMGRSDNSFIYLPAGPEVQDHTQWVLRYAGGFAPLADSIRAAVRSLDPDLVIQVAPLEKNLEFSRSGSRVVAVLAGSLGALALLLASMGIYGVVSFAVSRRLREIGIRMALGADRSAVRRLVLAQAMRPVGIGALCGIALCAGVSRVLSSLLFGIGAHDPVAFVAVPVLLIAVALAASYLPARRATNVDPASTLRHE
jgi:predicted lysophospholipase L1 biosynthesis ABC-type transport system permease subunit